MSDGLRGMSRLPRDTVRARRNATIFASDFVSVLGDGLTVAGGYIVIDLAADKGLEFIAGDLATKIQSPLICDAAGLGIDPGNGIAITGTELVVDLAANKGLEFIAGDLATKIQSPLICDAGGLGIDPGNGLEISGTELVIDLAVTPGLEFSGGDLIAKVAAPIALDATGIHLDYSDGLCLDGTDLAIDLAANPGLEFSAGDLICKVAAPIALDATGIHLDYDTNYFILSGIDLSIVNPITADIVSSNDITAATFTAVNAVDEFSTDGTLVGNSDTAIPTEQAVKTYVDSSILTQEEVEDYAGALVANVTGTHTGIAITYQDATNDMDFIVDHDAATNYVGNEHIDHTGVIFSTTAPVTGGGDLSANRTIGLSLDATYLRENGGELTFPVWIGDTVGISFAHTAASSKVGEDIQFYSRLSANAAVHPMGIRDYHYVGVHTGMTNTGGAYGMYAKCTRNDDAGFATDNGTLAALYGIRFVYGHGLLTGGATPQTSVAHGVSILPRCGTGTITSMYDLYLGSLPAGGTVTNRWSIYQIDGSTRNYFASNSGFGTNNPQEDVHAADTIRADVAFNLNGTDGLSGTLDIEINGTRKTLTFTGGILTAHASPAATGTDAVSWT